MALLDALKINIGSKQLSVLYDADGKEIKPEVREDEEQKVKCDEIIDLLYAAGYFRARIKGLSSFDKVIGGMTWCIDSCDVNIDIDLLFKEDLNIGQRLLLSEQIVSVLPKIKCPHRIEPHQIHGLDFKHIYPVIQWLVKHSIERRRETERYNRSYAVRLFDKRLESISRDNKTAVAKNEDDCGLFSVTNKNIIRNINYIQNKYRPKRKYIRTGAPPFDPSARVTSTLFEYEMTDHIGQVFASNTSQNIAVPCSSEEGESNKISEPEKREEVVRMVQSLSNDEIANTMTALSKNALLDNEIRLPAVVVGNIVSIQAKEIAAAAEQYKQLRAKTEQASSVGVQLMQIREKFNQLEEEKHHLESELDAKMEYLAKINEHPLAKEDKDGSDEIAKKQLSDYDQQVLRKLQRLVSMNELLRQQEAQFREQCRTELATLQSLVREAEEAESLDSDGSSVSDTDKDILDKLNEKLVEQRLVLGQRTRSVVALQRQLDQVPSRAELAQYQRRFMELYNQVSGKHRETKQYYAAYNVLNSKHQYLNKELNILDSIQDTYIQAMSSPLGKEQFMTQLEQIMEGVQQNKNKVEDVKKEERKTRDCLSAQLLTLIDQQRQYVAALKQLNAECYKEAAARPRSTNPLQL